MSDIWERQRGESSRAYHAFAHYRDLPPATRSIDRAWHLHSGECLGHQPGAKRRSPKRWRANSSFWGWVDRAAAWDAEIDRQTRVKNAARELEARERHQRLAQGTLTTLSAPIRAVLEALQDPAPLQGLTTNLRANPEALIAVLGLIARCAQVMPAICQMERLALGMSTDFISIGDERRERGPSIGFRIPADPVAVDLAIALLDRIAGTAGEDPDPTTH